MRRILRNLALCLFALPLAVAADPARLVADLKTGVDAFDPAFPHPSFYGYATVGNRVVFFGLLPEGTFYGSQPQCGLWSTDGTSGGTVRLADLCTRLEDLNQLQVRMLGSNGSVAFLSDAGGRLWRTDGTTAGTFPLGTVRSDPYGGAGAPVIGPGGLLFFSGCTVPRGCEPWRSDGTPQGTRLLRDVRPGKLFSSAGGFTVDGSRVLFAAAGGLWTTDGTAAGTTALVRVAPDTTPMGRPVRRGDKIYFAAYPGPVDFWVYDVKTLKTVRIGSFPTDYRHESGAVLELAAGRVFIRQYDYDSGRSTLWETDGTKAGTRPLVPQFFTISPVHEAGGRVVFAAVRDVPGNSVTRLWTLAPGMKRATVLTGCPEGCPEADADLFPAATLGNRLYFVGKDAQHGHELWSTDGTGPGTRRVKDLCPGDCEGWPYQMAVVSGRLLLVDREGGVWTSDGTSGGTVRLGETAAPGYPGQPFDLAVLGGRVFFSGFDDVDGNQPWRSDLTPAGTGPVGVIGAPLAASSWPYGLAALGGKVLFQACDNTAGGLWASDGTEGGTLQLPETDVPCDSTRFGRLFVPSGPFAFYGWNKKLWRTDGTPAGTVDLLDLPDTPYLYGGGGALIGDRLLFLVNPDSFPYSTDGWIWTFWTSDGTPAGTREAFPFRFGGSPNAFTASSGLAYFYAQSSETPYPNQLWRTDGTEVGTFPILSNTGGGGFEIPMVRLGARTLFIASQRAAGPELWSTDGTAAGTAPVVSSLTGERPRNPLYLKTYQGNLYFFARSNLDPKVWGLWRSDGTEAGTRMLKALPLPQGYEVLGGVPYPEPTAAGSFLFFHLDDNVHGPELWRTDGTDAGTVMVKDIDPGPGTSRAANLTAAGGRLYFTATDGEHGYELWVSDGTESGTRMVMDIDPGPAPSNPDQLTAADGRLYFNADDGEHGRELWVLPLLPR